MTVNVGAKASLHAQCDFDQYKLIVAPKTHRSDAFLGNKTDTRGIKIGRENEP